MRFFIAIFCILLSGSAFAASNLIDSIGVENLNGKQVILHKVEAKETYYSISRLYKIAPKNLIDFNNNHPLTIGAIVKIPTQRGYAVTENRVAKSPGATESSFL